MLNLDYQLCPKPRLQGVIKPWPIVTFDYDQFIQDPRACGCYIANRFDLVYSGNDHAIMSIYQVKCSCLCYNLYLYHILVTRFGKMCIVYTSNFAHLEIHEKWLRLSSIGIRVDHVSDNVSLFLCFV